MLKKISMGAFASITVASGVASAEIREFEFAAFTAVAIASGVEARINIGEPQSVRVETDEGDIDDLIVRVRNGVLEVRRDWKKDLGMGRRKAQFTVVATVADLNAIDASSGASVVAKGVGDGDFAIDASSGASVSVTGACDKVTANASSGARIEARDMICTDAKVDGSSGAVVSAHATASVDADASSGARITIHGGASDVTADKSSGGVIEILD